MFSQRQLARTTLVCLCSLLAAGTLSALELGIAPLRVGIQPLQTAGSVTVTNQGQEKVAMQVEALTWMQDQAGQSQLDATDVVLAVPPIFELAPGESQLVRVGLLTPNVSADEMSFRLLLTELSPPAVTANAPGLRVRTRVSIPVFVQPATPVSAQLRLTDFQVVDGEARLRLQNTGQAHARIEGLQLLDLGRRDTAVGQDLATYLLPGVAREFRLRLPAAQSVGYVRIRTSEDPELDLPVLTQPMAADDAQLHSLPVTKLTVAR